MVKTEVVNSIFFRVGRGFLKLNERFHRHRLRCSSCTPRTPAAAARTLSKRRTCTAARSGSSPRGPGTGAWTGAYPRTDRSGDGSAHRRAAGAGARRAFRRGIRPLGRARPRLSRRSGGCARGPSREGKMMMLTRRLRRTGSRRRCFDDERGATRVRWWWWSVPGPRRLASTDLKRVGAMRFLFRKRRRRRRREHSPERRRGCYAHSQGGDSPSVAALAGPACVRRGGASSRVN